MSDDLLASSSTLIKKKSSKNPPYHRLSRFDVTPTRGTNQLILLMTPPAESLETKNSMAMDNAIH